MSIAPSLGNWLEQPEQQAQLRALRAAPILPAMVMVALHIGLMIARWLLEQDLKRRAEQPQAWEHCPHCGSRLTSKGFQRRQMQTLVGTIA